MQMPLPMQTLPDRIRLRSRREALSTSLHGRLEGVSDVAKNQICHAGSVGNVGCLKPFVGDLTGFVTHTVAYRSARSMAVEATLTPVGDRNKMGGSRVMMGSSH